MKIQKFNENIEDINNDEELKKEYNSNSTTYKLYGEFIPSLRNKYGEVSKNIQNMRSEICGGELDWCLKFYKIHNDKILKNESGSYDNLFIVKEEITKTLIEKSELNIILSTKKYNL